MTFKLILPCIHLSRSQEMSRDLKCLIDLYRSSTVAALTRTLVL